MFKITAQFKIVCSKSVTFVRICHIILALLGAYILVIGVLTAGGAASKLQSRNCLPSLPL
jgi:multisubunit Na+/H+ antiporter MnhB subunit